MKPGKPMRRSRIKPVSAKRKAERPLRAATVAEVVQRDRRCQIGPAIETYLQGREGAPADRELMLDAARACQDWAAHEVHEPGVRARDIGSHLDAARAMLACGPCHRWAHHRIRLARLVGAYRSVA